MHEFYFESAAMILTLDHGRKDAGSTFQGEDYRCAEKSDEAGAKDSDGAA